MIVLAVDIGTSSAKAQRFDEFGHEVGAAVRRPTPLGEDGSGDANAVAATVDDLIDEVGPAGPRPDAVALSCAWHTLVGLDGDGRPTTELSTWLDTRAAREAAELRDRLGDPEAVRRRTGAPVHPSLPPARLRWLARHEPELVAVTERWCSLPELLESRWFGVRAGPSSSIASGSGLYDQERREWDGEVLDAIGVSTSTLASVEDGPREGLAAAYRERWPALDGIPWLPGLGDGACAVVGSGYGKGRAALTVGTSAAIRLLSSGQSGDRPAALFAYLLDPARAVVGVARSNAGSLEAWARRVLRVDGEDLVGAATTGRRPGDHGLEVVSSLGGERSPRWPIDATGQVSRVRLTTTTLDVLQALVEDAVLGLVESLEILEAWAGPLTLVLSGGAAASAGWRRLLADASGRELVRCRVGEVSARGAALAALARLGAADTEAAGPADGEVIRPDAARSETFAALRAARSSKA